MRITVREPDKPQREVTLADELQVGRECDGLIVADPKVSRRHVMLSAGHDGLVVRDLGSSNGTLVNGARIEGASTVGPGDIVRIGSTEIALLADASAPRTLGADAPSPVMPPGRQAPPRPALEELAARPVDGIVIRYRPGSAGEDAVSSMARDAARARRRLAGLGSEPWGVPVQLCLVDPFPDPDPGRAGDIVTAGTVVDPERNEIWMVVTPESPPESPERPLAAVFGAALPAADELGPLLEGYGLYLFDEGDPDPALRELELTSLAQAEGEVATLMAHSFVAYLIRRGGPETFHRLLATARPGRVDTVAQELYGAGLARLEESWRRSLAAGEPGVKAGQFLRLTARYLRPHLWRELEMFFYMLVGLGFTVVFPFAFRRLLDVALPSGEFDQVLTILAFLGGAFALSSLANLRRAYLAAYVSAAVVRRLRQQMFDRIQALHLGWFSRQQEGDVLARLFTDVGSLEVGLSQALREGLFQLVSLVVSAAVLLTLDVRLAAVVLAGAPLVALVYRLMAKGARTRSLAVQEETGRVLTVASENYTAQPVVKVFALEGRERRRFDSASGRLFRDELRLQLFGGLFSLSVNMVVTTLRLVVLGLGAWLVLEGNLTLGTLVAFMSIMGETLSPVTMLTNIGQQIQASSGALLRIREVLDAVPEVADPPSDASPPPLPPLARDIRLAGVSFSHTREAVTLEDIDAVIPAGSRVAFVGPTGAGKSSVLGLLTRSYDPDAGAVLLDGRDIRSGTLASLRAQCGVVFQDTFLFDTTIRENIALGMPGASDADIEAAARAAELHEFIAGLPAGFDTLVGEQGTRLSGGQRQRIAIARALIRDPRLLILDEATSALDTRTERLIAATLDRVSEGRTTVAVTHRLTSVVAYDRIFVLVAGRLVEHGDHDELVRAGGVYAQLWQEQSAGLSPERSPDGPVPAGGRRLSRVTHDARGKQDIRVTLDPRSSGIPT